MKTLRQIHLYLGCLFAPLLIYFSITGAWQLFRMNDVPKTGDPGWHTLLHAISNPHTHSTLPYASPKLSESVAFSWLSVAMACGIVVTASLGILLALRFSRRPAIVWLCIATGVVLPIVLLWLANAG